VNVNIHSGPGSQYPIIGILAQGQSAEVVGVSPDRAWWAIKYPPPGPSPTEGAIDGQGWVEAQFVTAENAQNVPVVQPPPAPTPTAAPPVVITEWKGEYFDNRNLEGEPAVVRNDAEIYFDWTGQSPAPGIPPENYSVRWTISRDLPAGTYRFNVWVDDGVRMWVDEELIIDGWQEGAIQNFTVDVSLDQGTHGARVEYFQAVDTALIQLEIGSVEPPTDGTPVAVISGPTQAEVEQPVVFSARNSQAAEGSHITTFDWAFGDGTVASGVDLTHTYTSPGPYEVTLTVTDDKRRSHMAVHQIQIGGAPTTPGPDQPPVAVISAPSEGVVGQPITFDASNSQSANPVVSYLWDFGDGTTANAVTVDKTYSAGGVYNVNLTVVDDKGQQGSDNTQIAIGEPVPGETPTTPPPEATAPIPKVTPLPEETLTVLPPEATTPTAPIPEATMLPPEAITPSPELTPTLGSGGGGALTALIIAIVRDGPLQAIFTPGQAVVVAVGQPVEFDGSGSQAGASEIVSYNWSFGDGGAAAEPVVSHTYAAPGNYTASLTVTDATGASNTATSEVQVYAEDFPTPES
jgi:PKD repeat protein/uncharacterized protein YraI